jgi:amino acid transporter
MDTIDSVAGPNDPVATKPDADRLHGRMGILQLTFTVLAYNAPIICFLGFIPVAIMLGNGAGSPLTFLVCGGILIVFATGILAMAKRHNTSGGFYGFITAGLGKVVGLGAGLAAMIAYFAACLAGYALGGISLDALLFEATGLNVPWWVGGLVLFALAGVLGYFHIELSAKALTIFLAFELALTLLYCVCVVAKQGFSALDPAPFALSNVLSGSIGIAIMFGVGMFGGFEATIIFRDEVRNPARTIPRATYLVIALLGTLYALTAWVFINSYGPETIVAVVSEDPTGAVQASLTEFVGPWATNVASILLLTSSFALILATHNIVARYAFNLSADGILPKSLSRIHSKHTSPHRASMATSAVSLIGLVGLAVAASDPNLLYAKLAGTYAYLLLVLFVLAAAAVTNYLWRQGRVSGGRVVGTAVGTALAGVVFVFALYVATVHFDLVSGATGAAGIALLVGIYGVIAAGMVAAAYFRKRKPETYARIGRQDA